MRMHLKKRIVQCTDDLPWINEYLNSLDRQYGDTRDNCIGIIELGDHYNTALKVYNKLKEIKN